MKNNGGPAFPSKKLVKTCTAYEETVYMEGMSLRDYFAAKILAAIFRDCLDEGMRKEIVAEACYNMADAMLKVREKTNE